MKQRITFVATLEIDSDPVGWNQAEVVVEGALLEGDGYNWDKTTAKLVKVTKLEMMED